MKKITAEEIIDLISLPLTDIKVIETLDALGIEQPVLDEEYKMEGELWTEGEEKIGVAILFAESDMRRDDGEPLVEQIDFYHEEKVPFPLGLHKSDGYETVIKKLGRKPDFCIKLTPWRKQWVFPFDDKELVYAIHFKSNMKSIDSLVVAEFDRESVEKDEFVFPCSELEK